MAGLRQLTFPSIAVKTSGGDITVRGLSLDHILSLFHRHRGELSGLFDRFAGKATAGGGVNLDDVQAIGAAVTHATPLIVAEIISLAAGGVIDSPTWLEEVAIARSLTAPEQIDALQKIAAQTFTSDMPPKKLLLVVLSAAQGATSLMQPQIP